jgi:Bacterial Ig domain
MSNSPIPRRISDDCPCVLNELGLRWSRRRASLLGTAAILAGVLGVGQALAATAKPKPRAPQNPSFYTLGNKKAKCRAHYSREAVTIRVRRHRHSVAVHQVRCVYTGAGSSLGATVSFPTDLPTAAVIVTVIPGAVADSYGVAAGQTLEVGGAGVLANDDGSGLAAVLVSGPAHGVLTLNRNGTFRYTPASGFSGVEHFSYKDTDASGESSLPAAVTIHVTPVLGQVAGYEVTSGSTLSVGAPGVLGAAAGSALQASLLSDVSDGSLTLNPDGSFSYTPSPGFSGSDSFTVRAVDGAAQDAGTETVTIIVDAASSPVVAQAPVVFGQDFYGAAGNTVLQVGGTRGTGPEVYRPGASALAGDSDPGGGSLSATPATIPTAQGGSVTLAANGTFTYQPPVGFGGPTATDTFNYQVDASEGTSAPATATIHFGNARVWYVDNTAVPGGDGSSAAPLNTLAAVSGHAVSGDDIFVFDGSGPYAGGVVLGANQTLVGQSVGLTVGSDTVVPAAGGANPVIASSSGADVTLGENDTVTGMTVTNTGGIGISASNLNTFTVGPTVNVTSTGGVGISATSVNTFTVGSTVAIANTGGDGLDVSGGGGTASVAAPITVHASGGVSGNSVAITGRTGGTLTLSGPITDDGAGVLVTNDTAATISFIGPIVASTGTHPAFTATGGGTVSSTSATSTLTTTTATALDVEGGTLIGSSGLVFQSISAGSGSPGAPNPVDGVVISGTGTTGGGLTVTGLGTAAGSGGTIQDATGTGASDGGVSVSDSGPLTLSNMTFTADAGAGVYVATVPVFSVAGSSISGGGAGIRASGELGGTTDGYLDSNTIGDLTANSGASVGDGIDLSSVAGGTLVVELTGNKVQQIAQGIGIFAQTLGTGTLDLNLASDIVTMGSTSSLNGVTITSGNGGAGTVCLNPSLNNVTAAGSGANGMEVDQLNAGSVFAIQGFGGGDVAAVASFLGSPTDLLTPGSGGAAALATTVGPAFTTPLAACDTPPTQRIST